jgi:GntR family transcriptional regulator
MIVHIRSDSPVPIYEQIVTQVTYAIAAGGLEPGAQIPSARELADQLTVNPNTVVRAFQELERRGILTAQRGKAMTVADEAPDICQGMRQDIVREHIRGALREAASSGLSAAAVRQIVEEELATAQQQAEPVKREEHFKAHFKGKR